MANKQSHMISNGDVFVITTTMGISNFLFENGLYYKVIDVEMYFNEKTTIKHYRRTGLVLKPEDMELIYN